MKNIYIRFVLISSFLFAGISSYAQNNFFNDAQETDIKDTTKRVIIPSQYRLLQLDTTALLNFLRNIPDQKFSTDHTNSPIIGIPMPDGSWAKFHIWRTPIMEAALAAKYPGIITYTGQGMDDRSATIKIDWTSLGFHAMILSPVTTSVFIDPYQQGNKSYYISYLSSTLVNTEPFREGSPPVNGAAILNRPVTAADTPPANGSAISRPASILSFEPSSTCIAPQLRSYRIAIACTGEYAKAATGFSHPTVAQTLSAIVTTLNRVDGVYELELDIHFNLVANEDAVIFTDPNTEPFPPTSDPSYPSDMMFQSQYVIDSLIGDANYDLGQTFNTAGGGLTSYNGSNTLGIVCVSGYKSTCEVGLLNPVGDTYNIDYVSHEIGHEFGAYHSFNSVQGYCGSNGQWSAISNSEPGSGTTIMCYAEGIVGGNDLNALCGSDNLQQHSDPDFNALGFDEITNYSINGNGNNCAVISATGNTAPVVHAGADYTIPLSTPFVLTGSATDINSGDVLTYSWEQVDIQGPANVWNHPSGDDPLFRSFPPVTVPWRYFPKLSDVINNTTTIGELLPSYARVLHFRLTVRDNHAGGGGVCNGENAITVDGSSGPFLVTYPNASGIVWQVEDLETVTWNPAGTAAVPVNCSNVQIELSTDGGLTYPDTLVASTPNTGSAQILVPDSLTATARIRVSAVGNIFYDISDSNFTIQFPPGFFKWVSFTAGAQLNNTVLLNWIVDEVNSSYYQVERSKDGINFTPIDSLPATIVGGGNNDSYAFTDQNPLLGTSYYRIKETNQLGGYSYSSIDSVSLTQIPSSWTIYSTAARSSITVVSNANSNNTVLQFFDATGRLIYQDEVGQTIAGQSILIPVNRLAKGVYILKVIGTSGSKSKKILVD